MAKNQKVRWEIGDNYGVFLNQAIENIVTDEEGYAYGNWKGHLVAAFSIKVEEWHVIR